MTSWTRNDLERIGAADELLLASFKKDGTHRKPVTIWVVRGGDDLYTTSATPITDEAQVGEVVKKFRDKYGAGTVNTLYSRLDVAVEVPLT